MTTLAENGRIATAVSWRVDMVTRSSRGKGINKPVAVFTFRYAEGKREQQITLQMLPELVDELRNACSEILGE